MNNTPVFILDCHLRSQEGVLESLHRSGYHTIGLSWDLTCPSFSSRFLVETLHSPRLEDSTQAYVDFLIALPRRGILLLSNDLSALTLARHKAVLQSAGYQLLVPDLDTLEAAFDKWACFKTAREAGVKAPHSVSVGSLEEAVEQWPSLRKPVILKPTRLAGGNYVKLTSLDDLTIAWEKIERYNAENPEHESGAILQEWLFYGITDMWSCETVYDSQHKAVGFYSIQRIRSSLDRVTGNFTSRLFAGEHKSNPRLEQMTKALLDSLQWVGLAHVEYMYVADEDEYYLAEVNPRLPGYSYFPSKAGFELARYYCDLALGHSVTVPADFKSAVYFESFRYPGDISEGFYHLLKRNLSWRDYFTSYGKLLSPNTIKVIDPIRLSDLRFSLASIFQGISQFYKDTKSFLKRRTFKR